MDGWKNSSYLLLASLREISNTEARHLHLSYQSDKSTVYKEYKISLSISHMFKSRHEESRILTWEIGCLFIMRRGSESQLEHLGVLGLNQSINKLSPDQRIGQMSRDMQRSQRTDRHMSGRKGRVLH